jgi:hypothetical protein
MSGRVLSRISTIIEHAYRSVDFEAGMNLYNLDWIPEFVRGLRKMLLLELNLQSVRWFFRPEYGRHRRPLGCRRQPTRPNRFRMAHSPGFGSLKKVSRSLSDRGRRPTQVVCMAAIGSNRRIRLLRNGDKPLRRPHPAECSGFSGSCPTDPLLPVAWLSIRNSRVRTMLPARAKAGIASNSAYIFSAQ